MDEKPGGLYSAKTELSYSGGNEGERVLSKYDELKREKRAADAAVQSLARELKQAEDESTRASYVAGHAEEILSDIDREFAAVTELTPADVGVLFLVSVRHQEHMEDVIHIEFILFHTLFLQLSSFHEFPLLNIRKYRKSYPFPCVPWQRQRILNERKNERKTMAKVFSECSQGVF